VTITATGDGRKRKFPVTVKKNGNKPAVRVCLDELSVAMLEMVMRDGVNAIAFTVQNHPESGVAKKVKCGFRCAVLCESIGEPEKPGEEPGKDTISDTDENVAPVDTENPDNNDSNTSTDTEVVEKTVTVNFGRLQPWEEETVYYFGFAGLQELKEAELQILVVYSGEAKMKDDLSTSTVSYGWGTKDTTAPVIQGFVGKKSYNGNDIYVVLYEDRKTVYKKYISAYDDRDGKVEVKADLSMVNWKKKGTYTVMQKVRIRGGQKR